MHACCAPCLLIPYEYFSNLRQEVTVHYYNPNIHPYSEYQHRLQVIRDYCAENQIKFIEDEYCQEDYFRAVVFRERKPERCRLCFQLRLGRTALLAKENGFDGFTTTLLVSPYQLHEELRQVAENLAEKWGTRFLYQDFRQKYHDSVVLSRQLGMYRQFYCGCVFSEKERIEEKAKAKSARLKKQADFAVRL